MGATYGFWRQMSKEQKLAKQRYIHMLYSLQFRNLVRLFVILLYILFLNSRYEHFKAGMEILLG